MSKNKELVNRWFEEVWNQGKSDKIGEILDEECCVIGLDTNPIGCHQEMKAFFDKMNMAMDKLNIAVDRMLEDGNQVSANFTISAVHRATKKNISFRSAFIGSVEDGKIKEADCVVDFLTMFLQAGVVPRDAVFQGLTSAKIA